jgi:hypothetical protein
VGRFLKTLEKCTWWSVEPFIATQSTTPDDAFAIIFANTAEATSRDTAMPEWPTDNTEAAIMSK